ncbi:hypothetical protein ACTXJG_15935, partial [Glutamicibacter arilaitensis]|uniref:hypothetical protein n=1 Tax=Glutamicibacter arilaitensis TaxID=256701 RepID=UPI003FD66DA6
NLSIYLAKEYHRARFRYYRYRNRLNYYRRIADLRVARAKKRGKPPSVFHACRSNRQWNQTIQIILTLELADRNA